MLGYTLYNIHNVNAGMKEKMCTALLFIIINGTMGCWMEYAAGTAFAQNELKQTKKEKQ